MLSLKGLIREKYQNLVILLQKKPRSIPSWSGCTQTISVLTLCYNRIQMEVKSRFCGVAPLNRVSGGAPQSIVLTIRHSSWAMQQTFCHPTFIELLLLEFDAKNDGLQI